MDEIEKFPGPNTLPPPFLTFHGTPDAQAKLMDALAKARLEFGPVELSRRGQYGKREFDYAPLGSLTEATAKPLAKHGITVMNFFTTCPLDRAKQRLTTWVQGHGAQIQACLDFKPKEVVEGTGEFQGEYMKEVGKIQTYLVRYQYKAILTLDSEPDADDAPAHPPERRPEPRREPPKAEPRKEAKPAPQAKPVPQATLPPKPMEPRPEPEPAKQAPPPVAVQGVNDVNVANDVKPEPRVEMDEDGPASPETYGAIKEVFEKLRAQDPKRMNVMKYSEMVLELTGVPANELRNSARAAKLVLERLQTMALDVGAA